MTLKTAPARAFSLATVPREIVQEGFSRTAVGGDSSLVTINWLEPGLDLAKLHSHPFDQLSFVLSGRMTFFVGRDTYVLSAPAVIHIPANMPHGAKIPPDSDAVLNIDVFAPAREDYRYLIEQQQSGEVSHHQIMPEPAGGA